MSPLLLLWIASCRRLGYRRDCLPFIRLCLPNVGCFFIVCIFCIFVLFVHMPSFSAFWSFLLLLFTFSFFDNYHHHHEKNTMSIFALTYVFCQRWVPELYCNRVGLRGFSILTMKDQFCHPNFYSSELEITSQFFVCLVFCCYCCYCCYTLGIVSISCDKEKREIEMDDNTDDDKHKWCNFNMPMNDVTYDTICCFCILWQICIGEKIDCWKIDI